MWNKITKFKKNVKELEKLAHVGKSISATRCPEKSGELLEKAPEIFLSYFY